MTDLENPHLTAVIVDSGKGDDTRQLGCAILP
jgi:hypothetical protein